MNRPDPFEEDLKAVIQRDAPTAAPEQLRARVRAVPQRTPDLLQHLRRLIGISAATVTIVLVLVFAAVGAIWAGARLPIGAIGLAPPTSALIARTPSGPPSATTAATSSAGTGIVDIAQPSTVHAIRWSSDSQHLLIAGDGLEVFDRNGSEIMASPGISMAEWVGSGAVAAGIPRIANVGYGSVSIESLAGGTARLPGTYALDFVGAPNQLALVPASAKAPDGTGTFVVWEGGQLEGPYPGTPLAWSTDGRRLIATVGAVVGAPSGGRIRVWTFPGAVPNKAVSMVTVDSRYPPIFSPDGQTIAVPCGLPAASPDCAATVIDTTTMQARVAGNQPPGLDLSWLPSGELLLASPVYPQSGPLPAWSPSGTRQTALTGAWGVAGATGTVALESAAMGEAGATRVVAATGRLLASMSGAIELEWSPDGSCLLVRVDPQTPLHVYCQQP